MSNEFKESTDGKLLTGIFSHALQAVIIVCCKDALTDYPELLRHKDAFVTLARRCFEVDKPVDVATTKRVKVDTNLNDDDNNKT